MAARPVIIRVKRKRDDEPQEELFIEEGPVAKRFRDNGEQAGGGAGAAVGQFEPQTMGMKHTPTARPADSMAFGVSRHVFRRVMTSDATVSAERLMSEIEMKRAEQKMKRFPGMATTGEAPRAQARQDQRKQGRSARYTRVQKQRAAPVRGSNQLYNLVDLVREDDEDNDKVPGGMSKKDINSIYCNFMPLLREHLTASGEMEDSPIPAYQPQIAEIDPFLYDYYVRDDTADPNIREGDYQRLEPFYHGTEDEDEYVNEDPEVEDPEGQEIDYPDETVTSERKFNYPVRVLQDHGSSDEEHENSDGEFSSGDGPAEDDEVAPYEDDIDYSQLNLQGMAVQATDYDEDQGGETDFAYKISR